MICINSNNILFTHIQQLIVSVHFQTHKGIIIMRKPYVYIEKNTFVCVYLYECARDSNDVLHNVIRALNLSRVR